MSNRLKGVLCIVASAFGFAVMAACVRLADDYGAPISSIQKSFFRNIFALAIALVVFLRSSTCQGPRSVRAWGVLILRSILGTGGIFAHFYALSHISIAEGQTLNKTAPFFTVLMAWLFLREKVNRHQIAALVLAFVGVLLIAKPGFAGVYSLPLAMGVLGGVCAGGAYTCVRSLRSHHVDSAVIVVFFSAFSCLAACPFMAADFTPMTLVQVLVLLVAGAGAAIGQFGITAAYGFAAPREIAVYDYSNILFTAIFGFFLFSQVPDIWSVFGIIAIVIAAFKA